MGWMFSHNDDLHSQMVLSQVVYRQLHGFGTSTLIYLDVFESVRALLDMITCS